MSHEELKRQYAKDLLVNPNPHLVWEYYSESFGKWVAVASPPGWYSSTRYRRHPHADLILSHKPGDKWQCSHDGERWCDATPEWDVYLLYRRKPQPHAELREQYEKDLLVNPNAYLAWQVQHDNTAWRTCHTTPKWSEQNQYRRHPHADLILTYDPSTVYEWSKEGQPWQTVLNPPLWNEKLNYRKKPMAHETLKAQYAKDAETYNEPWKLWEYNHQGWATMQHEPCWDDCIQYRRKPEARPHGHLIHIWANGGEIQKFYGNRWVACQNPCWEATATYRQKPAAQTRFIPIFRMPASPHACSSVYVGEGKISLEDCKPSNAFDTLISVLEINISEDNSATLVKEHKP